VGSETRARLGLTALLVATLASFEQLFARSDYFGPAFLGLLLAAGIAMGGRRLGAGTLVTLLVSAAGLFTYLALVFEAPRTLYGLPTPGAAAGLAAAVGDALQAANLDFAPIPSRAGYVILVVVGMWLATTTAEIATFRWRRPLLATAPALGLFAFDLVVADPAGSSFRVALWLVALLTYLGLESSHRLSSWGRYITTWRDKRPEPDPVTGRLARRMAAACVIAAVASPVFLPALEGGMLAWRSDTGGGAPGGGRGGGGRIDLLATLVPGALSRSSVRLFEVDAAEAAKWRLASLSRFDGDTWHPSEGELRPASEGFPAAGGLQVPTTRLVQRVRIAGLDSDYLPAASTPAAIAFDGSNIGLDDIQIEAETHDLRFDGVDDGLTYEVTSVIPRLSYRALARAEVGAAPGEEYTQNPPLSDEVRDLRNRWTQGAGSPFEELVRIQEKLRGPAFTYSQSVAPRASNDYLADFLTRTRTGFCQQFAAAFAVLARSLDYPTRLSIGFLPGEVGEDPDHYVVRGSYAHAWPEVHFQGFGWVPFEPTPRSSSLAPDYTSAPIAGGGQVGGQIPGVSPDGAPVPGQARIRNEANEPLLGPPAPPTAADTDAWRRAFDRVALATALVLMAWLVAVPALKELRWRRRYRRAHTPRGAVIAAFAHFVEEASELATAPRPASESAVAYARRVTGNERGPALPALDLARLYEKAEYGAGEVSAADAHRARTLSGLLRSRLWASATWWERATRLFAPTGLRGLGEWRSRRAFPAARPREHDRAA
jgi:transglutaminase-like putative cysteine protease